MSDPRDDAFRALCDVVRRFNRSPSLTRRAQVESAAVDLVRAHKEADDTSRWDREYRRNPKKNVND